MEKLWAPWREQYLYDDKPKGCILCISQKANKRSDKKKLIIERSTHSFSILNKYPYNNGHVMIVPFRHVKDLEKLKADEILDMMSLLNHTKKILDDKLNPDGYNIGINLGQSAGAGIKGHVHIHIVPRWNGDTNFMPIFAKTKVISQSLDSLYNIMVKELC